MGIECFIRKIAGLASVQENLNASGVKRNATFGAMVRKFDGIERKLDSLLIDPETASEEEIRRHKERVLREATTPTPPEERAKIVDHDGRTIYP